LGATGYASEYDDYLYDFMLQDGNATLLIKRQYDTLSTKIFSSLLYGPDFVENLGTDYYGLKFTQDLDNNIYVTGLYSQELIYDTTNLFLCKFDKDGNKIWATLYEETEQPSNIFIDNSGNFFIHDNMYLIKIKSNGELLWKKQHIGLIRFYNNKFYKIQAKNVHDSFLYGQRLICDSILFEVIDTSGDQVNQKVINIGASTNSMISTNISFNFIDDRIFLCNSYWGTINVDPANSNTTFENTRTTYWGDKLGNIPSFNNYLAVYDTLGNLEFANSKIDYPRFEYTCMDSAGNLYFAGPIGYKTNFIINTDDSLIVTKSINDVSFIAKYSKNLDFYWIRRLSGLIKYLGISYYAFLGVEKLDIAGEYEGTINLDFERPNDLTFTSEGRDLFYAYYIISPTSIKVRAVNDSLLIYPNPCNGLLNIKLADENNVQLEIFDLTGKLKFSDLIINNSNINTIDISRLNNGYYIIRLIENNKIITQKLLISK